MVTCNYRIRVVTSEGEFEVEGDKKFVLEMYERYESGTSKRQHGSSKLQKVGLPDDQNSVSASVKRMSVGEFVRKTGLKKHTDIVLAFGFYLEKFADADAFSPADINSCYYDAKMESSNTSQMVIQNIKRGRIMEAKGGGAKNKGRKKYVLTSTGENYIAEKLNNSAK